jgi:hypothetical protein
LRKKISLKRYSVLVGFRYLYLEFAKLPSTKQPTKIYVVGLKDDSLTRWSLAKPFP